MTSIIYPFTNDESRPLRLTRYGSVPLKIPWSIVRITSMFAVIYIVIGQLNTCAYLGLSKFY